MRKRRRNKLVHEGEYIAEVDIELIEEEGGWSPYLSLDDAYKLDEVREALRLGDLGRVRRLARVFRLTPVDA
ncbi:MAG: hypothetical protein HYW07_19025 [Candidatus Latescibacteria bacterium]|nr:hypothetical protein [Candidatus Latescibacterota bacterium]